MCACTQCQFAAPCFISSAQFGGIKQDAASIPTGDPNAGKGAKSVRQENKQLKPAREEAKVAPVQMKVSEKPINK